MANVFETVPCGEIPGRNEVRLVRSYEHKARESVKILTKAHFKAAALCGWKKEAHFSFHFSRESLSLRVFDEILRREDADQGSRC